MLTASKANHKGGSARLPGGSSANAAAWSRAWSSRTSCASTTRGPLPPAARRARPAGQAVSARHLRTSWSESPTSLAGAHDDVDRRVIGRVADEDPLHDDRDLTAAVRLGGRVLVGPADARASRSRAPCRRSGCRRLGVGDDDLHRPAGRRRGRPDIGDRPGSIAMRGPTTAWRGFGTPMSCRGSRIAFIRMRPTELSMRTVRVEVGRVAVVLDARCSRRRGR